VTKEQIEQMVRYWQIQLRLQNWVIAVRWDVTPSASDAAAQVNKIDGRYYASVRFCPDILEYEDMEEVSLYVCHELTHLHLNQIWHTVEILLRDKGGCVISHDFIADLNKLICRDIEHATDALSTAFTIALPYSKELDGR
jgi:hypothetical protein